VAERISARLSRQEARRFGLVVGAAFLLLAALVWWRGRPLAGEVVGAIGFALILLGLLLPSVLSPVYRVWMRMAFMISKVTTPIFLAGVYFGVIAPIGIVRRLFGHDSLKRRPAGRSLWVVRPPGDQPSSMKHQF
jgi:hypothetical protein